MIRHTDPAKKSCPAFRKKFLYGILGLLLLSSGALSCAGGAGAPGGMGPPGGGPSPIGGLGGGNAGAPPLAIPAPEALNMTVISVSAPDSGGNATVTVGPGVGPAGDYLVVRNRGDIAWYRPLQNFFIPSAYAAGQTVTRIIQLSGDVFQIGAAANEELEFLHCLKSNVNDCSQGFLISVPVSGSTSGDTTKPASPPTGGKAIKSMTTDPGTGDTYIIKGSSRKKWDWMSLLIAPAYAQDDAEGSENGTTNGDAPVIPTNTIHLTTSTVTSFTSLPPLPPLDYTPATCSALSGGVSISPDPSLTGKTCQVALAPGNPANPKEQDAGLASSTVSAPQDLIAIPNCDPDGAGLVFFNENGDVKQKRLAVYSKNVVWIVNINQKKIDKKIAYWQGSNVSKVQYLGSPASFFTMLVNVNESVDLPHFAVNHTCWDIYNPTLFKGIKQIGGVAVSGGSIALTATWEKESCVIVQVVDVEVPFSYKVPESCQAEPLTDIVFLAPRYVQMDQGPVLCGSNFVALRPGTKQILYHFIREHNISLYPAWAQAACTAPSEVKTIPVPLSTNLKSMAYNGSDMIAILDQKEDGAYLQSFGVAPARDYPEKYTVTYQNSVKLEGQGEATMVLWSPAMNSFITNLTPTEGSGVTVTSTRRMRSVGSLP